MPDERRTLNVNFLILTVFQINEMRCELIGFLEKKSLEISKKLSFCIYQFKLAVFHVIFLSRGIDAVMNEIILN